MERTRPLKGPFFLPELRCRWEGVSRANQLGDGWAREVVGAFLLRDTAHLPLPPCPGAPAWCCASLLPKPLEERVLIRKICMCLPVPPSFWLRACTSYQTGEMAKSSFAFKTGCSLPFAIIYQEGFSPISSRVAAGRGPSLIFLAPGGVIRGWPVQSATRRSYWVLEIGGVASHARRSPALSGRMRTAQRPLPKRGSVREPLACVCGHSALEMLLDLSPDPSTNTWERWRRGVAGRL